VFRVTQRTPSFDDFARVTPHETVVRAVVSTRPLARLCSCLLAAIAAAAVLPPAAGAAPPCKPPPTASTVGRPAGLPAPTVLTGDHHTTHDGQVFDNIELRGRIYVDHRGVVFRNSLLIGDEHYAIYSSDKQRFGYTVERSELRSGLELGNGSVIRDVHKTGGNDGLAVDADDLLIDHVLIDHLTPQADAHVDGIQIFDGHRITIRDNWVDVSTPVVPGNGGVNAAILVGTLNETRDVTVMCNTMIPRGTGGLPDGAGYTLRLYDVGGYLRVGHNRFGRGHFYGAVDTRNLPAPPVWCDNAYLDGPPVETDFAKVDDCGPFAAPFPSPPPGAGPPGSSPRPRLTVRVTPSRLRTALRRGLAVRVSTPGAGRIRVTARRGRSVLARGTAQARGTSATTVRAQFTRRARRALRGRARIRLTLDVRFTPASGAEPLRHRLAVTLRR
jgi:hypothetical protein